MTPRILVLEGPDGCGKSTHADRLAAALRAESVDAVAFHHAKPADADPVLAALDYAAQRRRLVLAPPAAVIVADRWTPSTWCLGYALSQMSGGTDAEALRVGRALRSIAKMESRLLPPCSAVWLHALYCDLRARLAARGTPSTPTDKAMRDAYFEWWRARVSRFDTSRPADVVAAELLAWARVVLR